MVAVANANVVHVHYGTDEDETVRFDLSEGDRVTVDKRVSGWSRVSTADGERGWARDKDLVFVGPPYGRLAEVNVSSSTASAASESSGATSAK